MGMFDPKKRKVIHSDHRSYSGTCNGSSDCAFTDYLLRMVVYETWEKSPRGFAGGN